MSFDRQAFLNLIEGDKELASTLFDLFSKDWRMVFSDLEKAVDEGRHSDVEKLAHRLKGNLRNFFANDIAVSVEAIEDAGREHNLKGLGADLPELKVKISGFEDELKSYVQGL